jgi:hypothetical protein
MAPAVLAALVTALSPEAADRLSSAAALPGARVAIVVSADRAEASLVSALRLAAGGAGVTIVVEPPEAVAADAALELKRTLASLRGSAPDISLGVAGPLSRLSVLFDYDLAAYVDVAVLARDGSDPEAARQALGVSIWTSHTMPAEGTEADLRALASAGADAVLVRADGETRDEWLLAAASRLNEAPAADVAESITVVGARRLSAAEIVARHQAQAARQRRAIRSLISSGRMSVTFDAPGFSAPMVIEADTTLITEGGQMESGPFQRAPETVHRHIRVNGLHFRKDQLPRLPIIEPERVATPPLEIALTRAYRYELRGDAWYDPLGSSSGSSPGSSSKTKCYLIAFEPRETQQSLYRGRAWIDASTFALLRLEATQTNLRGSIVSSEQIDEYGPVRMAPDPRPPASDPRPPAFDPRPPASDPRPPPEIWLLSRSDVRQLYEGAGFRTPIRRLLVLDRHDVNPPAFQDRRSSALASDAIVLRDLLDDGKAQRVPTLIGGVLVDPNISRPLPFAGLNYSDFNLFGTGTQFNGFFGGTYGQAAWSVPSLAGSRWRLAGSAFAVLARYHDRAFAEGRERYDENLLQRPAHADVALVRPLSPRVALRLGYDLVHTSFDRAESTDPEFVVPASQWAHGLRLELQAQRAGWTLATWYAPARRVGWRAWGFEGAQGAQGAPGAQSAEALSVFHRWGVSAARTILLSRSVTGRVETVYMDGRDLDRFSRYAFGTFDNRLKGYPSASIRFDRGGVARTAVAWQAAPRLRLDGFLDTALVHDRAAARDMRVYTGIGAAMEMPLPFGLLAGVEWGYGFQGVNRDGSLGTHVIRVTAFKIF